MESSGALHLSFNDPIPMARSLKIKIAGSEEHVSGLLQLPRDALCIMALAHGAGAGMQHKFMSSLADALEGQGVGTLRFNFHYMERGGGRPDFPKVAHKALHAAIAKALPYSVKAGIPVVAGGKSFGGRMFSQLAAMDTDPGFQALVYFGFPLHAPGKPGVSRADHLRDIKLPMLFLQGTRDTLAQEDLIREVSKGLRRATLQMVDGADHGFHMLKKSGISDEEAIKDLAARSANWLRKKLK